jgi:hypothetical protein
MENRYLTQSRLQVGADELLLLLPHVEPMGLFNQLRSISKAVLINPLRFQVAVERATTRRQ